MLSLDDVYGFMYEHCDKVTTSASGSKFHCRCPICGDSDKSPNKKRFHLEYMDDNCRYNCFNCNQSGDFYGLYSYITGVDRREVWKKFHTYDTKSIKNVWKKRKIEEPKIETSKENLNWIRDRCVFVGDDPSKLGFIQLKYQTILKRFIEERKINIDVYICTNGLYKDRIVIPVFENGDIVYFQARSIHDDVSNKYLNPTVEKQNIIFNKDNFIKDDPIFITEGLIDAMSVNSNSTCCLGKTITDEFLGKIYEYTDYIYIVFDNDKSGYIALSDMIKTSEYSSKLKYFLMPKQYIHIKDMNQLKCSVDDIVMYRFIIENSYSKEKTKIKLILDKYRK